MSRVEKVEAEIQEMTADELAAFRQWFAAFDADAWDLQIESDARAGKLVELAVRALESHKKGLSTKL
jgi:hypothetical protein